ncbi:dihydrodipicolinate synthase family protein [Pendulispora albinea]|uniref:Dihydrodipicolinate synthase family protein n=1 Tax=Pendulispora albinea TaxID=2741071 RepID=A0ABZ2MC72_9BACT
MSPVGAVGSAALGRGAPAHAIRKDESGSDVSPRSRRKGLRVVWRGVISAITTPFNADLTVDHGLLAAHCRWLAENGIVGILPIGSLGEGSTLSHAEKRQILETCVGAVGDHVPVLPRISALGTPEAVALAKHARAVGCRGLMVTPPYVHSGDWREIRAHLSAVMSATDLPCLLYNHRMPNRINFLPEQIASLASDFPNLEAIKEPSVDVRRLTAIRTALGERLEILTCVEDAIVEGIGAGATGWIACLVNAFPAESVALFRYAVDGRKREAAALYRWFLPLLRMDTAPKYVQLIKLAQERVGRGSSRVRPPRLSLEGDELRAALDTIDGALATRAGAVPASASA